MKDAFTVAADQETPLMIALIDGLLPTVPPTTRMISFEGPLDPAAFVASTRT
jgi:hypothetical protein